MGEFVHMELNTADPEAAKNFYSRVFGWTYQDMPTPDGGTYSMAAGAEGPFGGIQPNPMPGSPSHWLAYVGVKSLRDTIAKAKEAGAQVVAEHDIPGMGTLAVFIDPQGATVAAWESATPPKPPKKKAAKKKTKKKSAKKKSSKKKSTKKKASKKKSSKKKSTKKKASKKKSSKKKSAKKKSSKKKRR